MWDVITNDESRAGRLFLMIDFLRRRSFRLYQQSIFYTLFGEFRIGGRALLDDRTGPFPYSPLAMLFYNQRTIFFACGFVFLGVLLAFYIIVPASREMWIDVAILWSFW